MPIEQDIKDITKFHKKITKTLNDISSWQTQHEKDDTSRFDEISLAVQLLPKVPDITKTIADTIQATVNGKIDDIKKHLSNQDETLQQMSEKIRPFSATRDFFTTLTKGILYLGGVSLAVMGIISLLKTLRVF